MKERAKVSGCCWSLQDIEKLESTLPQILPVHQEFLAALKMWQETWNFYDSCCKDVFDVIINVCPCCSVQLLIFSFPPRKNQEGYLFTALGGYVLHYQEQVQTLRALMDRPVFEAFISVSDHLFDRIYSCFLFLAM